MESVREPFIKLLCHMYTKGSWREGLMMLADGWVVLDVHLHIVMDQLLEKEVCDKQNTRVLHFSVRSGACLCHP